MSTDSEQRIVEQLAKVLLDILMLAEPSPLPARFESVESLQTICASLISLREILNAASMGDLSRKIPFKGYIGGTLKTLQANLKHLTWQTKMVASGDFSQRVDFMGEFAESFNTMVIQLDQTLKELVNKKMQLSQANADLLEEIAIRKRTEADLLKSREELKRLARTDSLTGLYNRGYFNRIAEEEIERALRYSHPLSLMMFDIDHFKRINDTFGHGTGDRVLKKIAHTSVEIFRVNDKLARYGGEEFIALLSETSASDAAIVAERLRRRIEEAVVRTESGPVMVTASFGVSDSFGRTNAKPSSEVLSDFVYTADSALYASKNAGRNRVTVFDPKLEPLKL